MYVMPMRNVPVAGQQRLIQDNRSVRYPIDLPHSPRENAGNRVLGRASMAKSAKMTGALQHRQYPPQVKPVTLLDTLGSVFAAPYQSFPTVPPGYNFGWQRFSAAL